MDGRAYRQATGRAWTGLLAHHGRPTAIQLAAGEPLLGGEEALLIAPTAGGKTIAYLAPLVARYCHGGDASARVVVISPTRALVNDLHRRIAPRLAQVGIACGRWTGDHHDGERPQAVTFTTPEGLDSRLSRAPEQLSGVRALVLDELHVLDGTARGDQLRILVQRMRVERRLEGGPLPLQVVAVSATVPDPERLALRYLVDPKIIRAGHRRPIWADVIGPRSMDVLAARLLHHARQGKRKVLVFCNGRREVEELAAGLRGRAPFRNTVFAHHGSLSRAERLRVEKRFQQATSGCCVATCTLELGVDIGDLDLVVCWGRPPNLSSLLQRAGRGNRRSRVNHLLVVVDDPWEANCTRALLEAQRDGDWHVAPEVFQASVLVQQAVSILQSRASTTVDAQAVHRRLPADLQEAWPEERIETVLHAAASRGWLTPWCTPAGRSGYRLGDEGEREWHRGTLHANLEEKPSIKVIDAVTREVVGTVADPASRLALGAVSRIRIGGDARHIITRARPGAEAPRFRSTGAVLASASQATAFLRRGGIAVGRRYQLGRLQVLVHGLGDAGGALLAEVLRRSMRRHACRLVRTNGYLLAFEGILDGVPWPNPQAVEATLRAHHGVLASRLPLGRFHAALPVDEQVAIVAAFCEADAVRCVVVDGLPDLSTNTPALLTAALEAR